MGHLIDYIAAVPETRVREWLATLRGFTFDTQDATRGWEGTLSDGSDFWAYSIDNTTHFRLCAKYTGLFLSDPLTLELASRFEAEIWHNVAPVPLLRLDELLFNKWQAETSRDWWDFPAPLDAAVAWLRDKEPTHWKILAPPRVM